MLFEDLFVCTNVPDGGQECALQNIGGAEATWLVLETSCFYAYMFATCVYTMGVMIVSACRPARQVSDFKKAVLDHIVYASINLTWFALNFVLVCLPPFCIFVLERYTDLGTLEANTASFHPIMCAIWATHLLTFLVKLRIYKLKDSEETGQGSNDDDYQRPSNEVKAGDTLTVPKPDPAQIKAHKRRHSVLDTV